MRTTRVTRLLSISNIKVDREPIGPATLRLVDYLRGGGQVPPIKVELTVHGQYVIRDGRHRLLAHKLLGRGTIEATYSVRYEHAVRLAQRQRGNQQAERLAVPYWPHPYSWAWE